MVNDGEFNMAALSAGSDRSVLMHSQPPGKYRSTLLVAFKCFLFTSEAFLSNPLPLLTVCGPASYRKTHCPRGRACRVEPTALEHERFVRFSRR